MRSFPTTLQILGSGKTSFETICRKIFHTPSMTTSSAGCISTLSLQKRTVFAKTSASLNMRGERTTAFNIAINLRRLPSRFRAFDSWDSSGTSQREGDAQPQPYIAEGPFCDRLSRRETNEK